MATKKNATYTDLKGYGSAGKNTKSLPANSSVGSGAAKRSASSGTGYTKTATNRATGEKTTTSGTLKNLPYTGGATLKKVGTYNGGDRGLTKVASNSNASSSGSAKIAKSATAGTKIKPAGASASSGKVARNKKMSAPAGSGTIASAAATPGAKTVTRKKLY